MNWFKKLFRKKPSFLPVSGEEMHRLWAADRSRLEARIRDVTGVSDVMRPPADEANKPRDGQLRAEKSLPPQDVETICREEESFTHCAKVMAIDDVMRGLWLAREIARLKRNKKKFSHLQAELEELTR